MRHVSDDERRARLAARHSLTPSTASLSATEATRAMTVLHSTEPATVYLSAWARVPGITVADIDRDLYTVRSVTKQLAMRRTLFVAPRDLLPALLSGPGARVARTEHARIAKDAVTAGVHSDGVAWLDEVRADVLAHLDRHPEGITAQSLREAVPSLDVRAEGVTLSTRVLVQLGARGDIARGTNTGHWRTSRPRWTRMEHWMGGPVEQVTADEAYREIVARWLRSFGPGTESDIVWWLGATKAIVRRALAELDAVEVALDGGHTGWLLPDDLEPVETPEPWTALLPVLDPTVMGWKERDFYLGPHRPHVFDRNGNAGTTVWVEGRIAGAWTQGDDARVRLHLVEEISPAARRSLDRQAELLTEWLDGTRIGTVYPSPAMKTALGR